MGNAERFLAYVRLHFSDALEACFEDGRKSPNGFNHSPRALKTRYPSPAVLALFTLRAELGVEHYTLQDVLELTPTRDAAGERPPHRRRLEQLGTPFSGFLLEGKALDHDTLAAFCRGIDATEEQTRMLLTFTGLEGSSPVTEAATNNALRELQEEEQRNHAVRPEPDLTPNDVVELVVSASGAADVVLDADADADVVPDADAEHADADADADADAEHADAEHADAAADVVPDADAEHAGAGAEDPDAVPGSEDADRKTGSTETGGVEERGPKRESVTPRSLTQVVLLCVMVVALAVAIAYGGVTLMELRARESASPSEDRPTTPRTGHITDMAVADGFTDRWSEVVDLTRAGSFFKARLVYTNMTTEPVRGPAVWMSYPTSVISIESVAATVPESQWVQARKTETSTYSVYRLATVVQPRESVSIIFGFIVTQDGQRSCDPDNAMPIYGYVGSVRDPSVDGSAVDFEQFSEDPDVATVLMPRRALCAR
ncbi:hypothetical protein [Gordonia sp. NPDC057248]|uniref:hypothetical protein n=1 Tax=Gordonia sp. NPDC057248 TaxID=3346066 RepID=UPI003631534E